MFIHVLLCYVILTANDCNDYLLFVNTEIYTMKCYR